MIMAMPQNSFKKITGSILQNYSVCSSLNSGKSWGILSTFDCVLADRCW